MVSYSFTILALVLGVVAGAAPLFIISKNQSKALQEQCATSAEAQDKTFRERLDEKDAAIARIEADRTKKDTELTDLQKEVMQAKQQLARAQEQAASAVREKGEALQSKQASVEALLLEKEAAVDQVRKVAAQFDEKMKESFGALSGHALKNATEEFLKLAKETFGTTQTAATGELELRKQAIETLLKPVNEGLVKLEKHCSDMELKRELAYQNIETKVFDLLNATGSLSNALKRPTIRGSWGEHMLLAVVEGAGLMEGHNFTVQHSTDTDDGKLRADMVIKLPKERNIALDSKTPLDSFREAIDCKDVASSDQLFKKYASTVRNHMRSLSEKRYWQQYDGLDCVIMFLPSEAMFYAAMEHDPSLIADAKKSKVYIVNPSTLIALLDAIAHVLDQEKLNKSAEEISKIGRNLYDGIKTFGSHFAKVGKNLDLAVRGYNDSVRSLERSVVSRARQLKEKGVGGDELAEFNELETVTVGFQSQELLSATDEIVVPLSSQLTNAVVIDHQEEVSHSYGEADLASDGLVH